jgi:hypothetical protein
MTKHIRTVRTTKLKVAWMLALATSTIVAGVAQSRTLPEQPNLNTLDAQVRADIHRLRQIGWRQDRSAIPELVQILEAGFKDQSDHPISRYRPRPALPWSASYLTHLQTATIVALGRIGDPRALPVLEKVLSSDPFHPLDPTRVDREVLEKIVSSKPRANWSLLPLTPFAEVAVARIKAEQAVPRANTLAKWQEQVRHFFDAVGMSLPEMVQQLADENKSRHPYVHDSPPSRARVALRALAEMAAEAYREGCRQSFDWLSRAGIAWDADIGARLTVELARRPSEQRLSWLMEQMRPKTVLTPADSYLSQAIADLSDSAVPALEKWLQELWAARAVETRNPDKTYTHTDNMIEEAYWLLSATGSDAALRVLKAQYEHCRGAGEESLEYLLERVLRETPKVFVSDW